MYPGYTNEQGQEVTPPGPAPRRIPPYVGALLMFMLWTAVAAGISYIFELNELLSMITAYTAGIFLEVATFTRKIGGV